jgi:hypothetical protein
MNSFLIRSYSQDELLYIDKKINEFFKLGNLIAYHDCGHNYKTKLGGRKEISISENKILSSKTCSVCFKLKMTFFLNDKIMKYISLFSRKENNNQEIDIEFLECKNEFYNWF